MNYLSNNLTGETVNKKTEFEIKNNDNILDVHFSCFDSYLFSFSDKDNGELYYGCVVEIFVQLDDQDSYLEIEVSPNNKTFVASILNRNITFIDNSFVKSNVIIKDNNYFVDIRIDLNKFNPKKIKYNAFRIERKDDTSEYELFALSPTLCGTFHVKDKFIDL